MRRHETTEALIADAARRVVELGWCEHRPARGDHRGASLRPPGHHQPGADPGARVSAAVPIRGSAAAPRPPRAGRHRRAFAIRWARPGCSRARCRRSLGAVVAVVEDLHRRDVARAPGPGDEVVDVFRLFGLAPLKQFAGHFGADRRRPADLGYVHGLARQSMCRLHVGPFTQGRGRRGPVPP